MIQPQFILPLATKLVVDLFAGGGGASTGIEQALRRHVDVAINHDAEAVSLHQANHPQTRHYVTNVWDVVPETVTEGREVGLLWASPDCRHFSPAKGGAPVSDRVRSLAWVVIKWASRVRPDVICLENIAEFRNWGPVIAGRPCQERKGKTFRRWRQQLVRLGYKVEFQELRACDYGVPTIRKRLFMVARCDGQPIVWPKPTHGPGLQPFATAASCIDWSLACPSIFERKKPLAAATERRIAHGIRRYVIEAAKPFIVPVTHQGGDRVHSIDEPLRTVTSAHRGEFALSAPVIARIGQTGGNGPNNQSAASPLTTITTKAEHLLVSPTLIQTGYGERPGQAPRVPGLHKPLGTAVDGQKHALVTAFLAKHYGGHDGPGIPVDQPASTITTQDHHHLVAAAIVKQNFGDKPGHGADEPLHTVTTQHNKHGLVAAHITKFHEGSVGSDAGQPLHTITGGGAQARPGTGNAMGLVTAHLIDAAHGDVSPSGVKRWGEGHRSVETPLPTVTAGGGNSALVASALAKLRGTSNSAATDEPLGTISAGGTHHAEVRAFLLKYYGADQDPRLGEPLHTVTTKDRFGLVTVCGEDYFIADIGMRMLQPRELYRAQGFLDSYAIERGADGRQLSKSAQVRMCGNSVCPPLARAIVAANYADINERIAA